MMGPFVTVGTLQAPLPVSGEDAATQMVRRRRRQNVRGVAVPRGAAPP